MHSGLFNHSRNWKVWVFCYAVFLALLAFKEGFVILELTNQVTYAGIWLFFVSLFWIFLSLGNDDYYSSGKFLIGSEYFRIIHINLNLPAVLVHGNPIFSIISFILTVSVCQLTVWFLYQIQFEFNGTAIYLLQWSIYYFMFVALPEEVFFRGMLHRTLSHSFITFTMVSSISFAIAHFLHSPSSMLIAAAFGFVLSTMRWYGASLITLVIAHGLINLTNNVVFPLERANTSLIVATSITCGVLIVTALTTHVLLRRRT